MNTNNPYYSYYVNQAGNGMGSFEGVRYQRGKGFFGTLMKSAGLPLLKYLGRQVLRTGVDVAGDIIDGEPLREALKTRTKTKLKEIANDGVRRAQVFAQTGQGRKYRGRGSKKNKKLKNKPKKLVKPRRKSKHQLKLPLF